MNKILLASTNSHKKDRLNLLARHFSKDYEFVIPSDLGVEKVEIAEDGDVYENAEQKARAYLGQTNLPILGYDVALVIPGEDFDPARVKRNALGGRTESELTREEIYHLMVDFYSGIAKKHGGEAEAHWIDALVLLKPNGEIRRADCQRPILITAKQVGKAEIEAPISNMYRVMPIGKYVAEMTEEEDIENRLKPIRKVLFKLIGDNI